MTSVGKELRSESGSSGATGCGEGYGARGDLQPESQVHGQRAYSGENGASEPHAAVLVTEREDSLANLPMTVKAAARFLGVSPQTVYLWVERKQIPHLRVMGRNIRFLKSDLEPFRAQFKHEVENGETK